MGEYVKYKGNEIKIGTCENLYYTSYQKYEQALKDGRLSEVEGNDSPTEYAKPDSGYRFRFPFPDEDKLSLGNIGNFHYHRGVPVQLNPETEQNESEQWKIMAGKKLQPEITQQKLVHRENDGKLCLALVVRNPESGLSYRIEEDGAIGKIVKDILRNHVVKSSNAEERDFYRKIVYRIQDGFRLEVSAKKTSKQSAVKNQSKRKHDKGLR